MTLILSHVTSVVTLIEFSGVGLRKQGRPVFIPRWVIAAARCSSILQKPLHPSPSPPPLHQQAQFNFQFSSFLLDQTRPGWCHSDAVGPRLRRPVKSYLVYWTSVLISALPWRDSSNSRPQKSPLVSFSSTVIGHWSSDPRQVTRRMGVSFHLL